DRPRGPGAQSGATHLVGVPPSRTARLSWPAGGDGGRSADRREQRRRPPRLPAVRTLAWVDWLPIAFDGRRRILEHVTHTVVVRGRCRVAEPAAPARSGVVVLARGERTKAGLARPWPRADSALSRRHGNLRTVGGLSRSHAERHRGRRCRVSAVRLPSSMTSGFRSRVTILEAHARHAGGSPEA